MERSELSCSFLGNGLHPGGIGLLADDRFSTQKVAFLHLALRIFHVAFAIQCRIGAASRQASNERL